MPHSHQYGSTLESGHSTSFNVQDKSERSRLTTDDNSSTRYTSSRRSVGSDDDSTVYTRSSSDRGQATLLVETINIAKNLLGTGVFSLPGGIALYSNSPSAIYNASVWVVVLGAAFGYFCVLIAKVCHVTNTQTYRDCWQASVGQRGGLVVSFTQALLPALGCLSYSAILTQTCRSLLESVGVHASYIFILLFVTVFAILPLCLLKNLTVLAPFSAIGTAGMLYTVAAMVLRCRDGSYQPGGVYYDQISAKPLFGNDSFPWTSAVLPYVCMVYESWVMHYNAPRYYVELKDATIPRFTLAVSCSFSFAAAVYVAIAVAGFLTFGGNTSSYILNNYSPHDPVMTLSRLTIGVSVLTIYPIAFCGFRDGILASLEIPQSQCSTITMSKITIMLLSIMTVIAMFVTDLGLINAVAGGTAATALCCVFPVLMYRQVVVNEDEKASIEVWGALIMMVVGIILGLVGVWQALVSA